ncbi:PRA1 family protein 2 [Symbiodinium microadriaticum]|uniref:PRA1 family protein 2 n=1 Tax=Symbiodinium microadriaticum TaxID=2951 RepID=A0A1Q9CDZ8_SYMMI|nr:PRA1 family protein 2 [Symbiodinium microadriaticum]
MNTSIRFLLLGDFRQLPAVLDSFAGAEVRRELKDSQLLYDLAGGWHYELSERWRFDEGVFSFLQWLRVDEAEQVPLHKAVHGPAALPAERRAPEDALLVQYAGPETVGTNASQTMRVWPGLRLVGAGGKVQKGVFVTVSEVEEREEIHWREVKMRENLVTSSDGHLSIAWSDLWPLTSPPGFFFLLNLRLFTLFRGLAVPPGCRMEDDQLFQDVKFDADLEGFYNGTRATVNLQQQATSFGGVEEPPKSAASKESADTSSQASGFGSLLGRLSLLQTFGTALGASTEQVVGAAVPTSLGSVKDQASSFMSKAQPWRQFAWPLSVPSANEGCSRISANVFNYQTNYAILFVVQLVLSVILQPSALMCIMLTVITWILFLKKNEDPDWAPKLGGVVLSPMQRWLLLAAITTIVLLLWVGGVIFNAALMYLLFFLAHGLLHDPGRSIGGGDPVPI